MGHPLPVPDKLVGTTLSLEATSGALVLPLTGLRSRLGVSAQPGGAIRMVERYGDNRSKLLTKFLLQLCNQFGSANLVEPTPRLNIPEREE